MGCFMAMLRGQCLRFNCKISQSISSFHKPQSLPSDPELWPDRALTVVEIPKYASPFVPLVPFVTAVPTHVVPCTRHSSLLCSEVPKLLVGSILWESLFVSALFSFSLCPFLTFPPCFTFYFSTCLPLLPLMLSKVRVFFCPKTHL